MDWKECNNKKLVKRISIDINLIDSLKGSSEKKLESANRLNLDETTATSIISLCYESLRELLEALSIKNGFKIYNHECYCAFLNEIIKEENFAALFDKFRKIRNGINYYGKDLSSDDAQNLKQEIIKLIGDVKTLLDQ